MEKEALREWDLGDTNGSFGHGSKEKLTGGPETHMDTTCRRGCFGQLWKGNQRAGWAQ